MHPASTCKTLRHEMSLTGLESVAGHRIHWFFAGLQYVQNWVYRTLFARICITWDGGCGHIPGMARGGRLMKEDHAMSSTITPSQTLINLQAAFNGESNASARYTAFAEKAAAEGYKRVATLFRAAARAEQVHAASHARVITRLGATPEAKIMTPQVGTTAENLAEAKKGEEHERDVMDPEFIREAQAAGQDAAVRTFRMAMEAEAVHATLYGDALAHLEAQRAAATFFVCPVCGEVTDDATLERCPLCNTPKEKFEVFHS